MYTHFQLHYNREKSEVTRTIGKKTPTKPKPITTNKDLNRLISEKLNAKVYLVRLSKISGWKYRVFRGFQTVCCTL